jgi:hypothetical protein
MVFEEFVRSAALQASGIESRLPPEPDIHCVLFAGGAYFELMRIADPSFEEAFNNWAKGPYRGYGGSAVDLWGTAPRKLVDKIEKATRLTYLIRDTNRFDLVLYYDLDSASDPLEELVRHTPKLESTLPASPFSRIWVFDRSWGVIGVIQAQPFRVHKDSVYPRRGFRVTVDLSSRRV